ncbi:calcium:proton antiporter [Cytophaga hutchinsonii]|nr:ionic transporter y4hA [Cytophaga hutchinsonii]SFX33475.1 Ca2+:H+ antiporter [Cytophaga hutchinsonii ATCC 33406]
MKLLLQWTIIIPILAWALFFSGFIDNNTIVQIIASILLILSVMSAVHHSEIIAHRVGEPYGTIILAIAITVIEVSIIVSLMVSGGQESVSLARDTVYSATMLILNGIVGLSLFIGGLKHHEQEFSKHSVTIALVSLISIVVFTLVVPTFTESVHGSYYSTPQLIFASIACLVIYFFFLFAQTSRHREYFLSGKDDTDNVTVISNWNLAISLLFLLVSLGIVVLLAKTLSPTIESIIISYQLPVTLVGVVIAIIILLPECIAAIIAARNNKLQTSLNLSLGSALASIGLTIPSVAVVCIMNDMKIIMGLDIKSIILLGLSVFTVMLSLSSGRTNIVYGVVLLVNLFAFIFLIIYP